jgi:glycopeptide antibiotics resistance protein
MRSRVGRVPLWCWWTLLVWIVSFPWSGLTSQPRRSYTLVPFTDPADKPSDVIINLLLFLPFGFSFAGRPGLKAPVVAAGIAAAIVSTSAEAVQLFSTVRYPSATDVTCAIAGSVAGAICRRFLA